MKVTITTALIALALLLGAGACGSAATVKEPPPTVGEIYQLILDSPGHDTDGDAIPDDVELDPKLDTDPDNADTDGDGVGDCFEVFGPSFLFVETGGEAGELYGDDPVLDPDQDGIFAVRDRDEWGEGSMKDWDGDGVSSFLECKGYTYDWRAAKFIRWTAADRQAHPEVEWFITDPLQPSTDQDAYPDGMEVSELLMDVAVEDPGRHPLVAAYPNIVIRLEGYNVTLNDEITYSKGGSLSKGQSWSRQTESSHSVSHSVNVEVGVEGGWEGGNDGGVTVKAHVNVGYGYQTTNTTSTAVGIGTSVNEEVNWNKARCYNPTAAAKIKLLLKAENHGTAPASNVVPTINLRIGGSNVATFRPANAMIEMLMPGVTYPEGDSIYWVVDTTENGPLMLTEWELKALERGAPVNIAVTQLTADVMRLDETGAWQPIGDINEHTARCQAVGASLYADFGDGKFNHYLVYAGEGPTAPVVTLRDALRWSMGATKEGRDTLIRYERKGTKETIQLTDDDPTKAWVIHMDQATRDGLQQDQHPLDIRLHRESHIELMAPRSSDQEPPTIYCAYAVPLDEGYDIVACVSDYDGIKRVAFFDRDNNELAMEPDGRGPWFFSCRLDGRYEFSDIGLEHIEVTSVNPNAAAAEIPVDLIHTVFSQPPIIGRLVYDQETRKLKAKVVPGGTLAEDAIAGGGIRLYHLNFLAVETQEDRDGYVTMVPTVYWFEDPDVYECRLPHGWMENMRVVAASAGGLYTAVPVANLRTLRPYSSGEVKLEARLTRVNHIQGEFGRFYVPQVDLECLQYYADGSAKSVQEFHCGPYGPAPTGCNLFAVDTPPSPLDYYRKYFAWPANGNDLARTAFANGDIYLRDLGVVGWTAPAARLGIQWHGRLADVSKSGKSTWPYYHELTRGGVGGLVQTFADGQDFAPKILDVFIFKTDEDRFGKLIITDYVPYVKKGSYDVSGSQIHSVDFEYVIFRKEGDGTAPPSAAYTTDPAYYTVGQPIAVNSLVFGDVGDPADTYSISPGLPDGLAFNDSTGDITGTPTTVRAETSYTTTCSNTGGDSTATVRITILGPIQTLGYDTLESYPTGYEITPNDPNVTESYSYAVTPTLPVGLELDAATGIISGTPTQVTSATDYTVTASNKAGARSAAILNIATPLGAPADLKYEEDDAAYTVGSAITPNAPTVTNSITSCTINPALPSGLMIHPNSGVISGTPSAVSSRTMYTVTATNAAGSDHVEIFIEVN